MSSIAENQLNERLCTYIPEKLQEYMKTLQIFDEDIEDYLYIYDLTAERVYFTN